MTNNDPIHSYHPCRQRFPSVPDNLHGRVPKRIVSRRASILGRWGPVWPETFSIDRSTSCERHSEPGHRGVLSSSGKPVSAKQNLSSPRPRGLNVFCQLLGFALLFWPSRTGAESFEDAAHELAMKVCVAAHKQPVKVAW